jgi:hypothetical protein
MYNEDSFYAINKLVDVAKSDIVQKQMISAMNEAVLNMRIPGVDNPMPGTEKKAEEEKPYEN